MARPAAEEAASRAEGARAGARAEGGPRRPMTAQSTNIVPGATAIFSTTESRRRPAPGAAHTSPVRTKHRRTANAAGPSGILTEPISNDERRANRDADLGGPARASARDLF